MLIHLLITSGKAMEWTLQYTPKQYRNTHKNAFVETAGTPILNSDMLVLIWLRFIKYHDEPH